MTGPAAAPEPVPGWLAGVYARGGDCPPHIPGAMRLPDTPAGTCPQCLHPCDATCHTDEGDSRA